MAGVDFADDQLPRTWTQTVLRGKALYRTDIHGYDSEVTPDLSDTHEVEVKIDHDGDVSMEIYTPRTLVSSIPLRGGFLPIGTLDKFKVEPSNHRENILCVIHQTTNGPKHEYLIFKRREEMIEWQDRLQRAVFTSHIRRGTDPRSDRPQPNTKRDGKTRSALNHECFTDLDEEPTRPANEEIAREEVERPSPNFPVEDDYAFDDEATSGDDMPNSPSEGDVGVDFTSVHGTCGTLIELPALLSTISEDLLQVPAAHVGGRSPSISTVSTAGAVSRQRRAHAKPAREMFRQLCEEKQRSEITSDISVEDACLLKLVDYQGHAWVRDCFGSSDLYAGDAVIAVNGQRIASTEMFRDRIETMTGENQVVRLSIWKLPHASLLMMRPLPSGELPFTTEGTKVKSVDVEHDSGLFEVVKSGNAYITGINSHSIPYDSTTAEVTAQLQNTRGEFLLVLHPRDFAEKMQ